MDSRSRDLLRRSRLIDMAPSAQDRGPGARFGLPTARIRLAVLTGDPGGAMDRERLVAAWVERLRRQEPDAVAILLKGSAARGTPGRTVTSTSTC